jgi:hypothetical protein
MAEELPINYDDFVSWLESQSNNKTIGITHSSSHSFFVGYLKEKTNLNAIYVFVNVTKACKNSNWKEYTNPDWMTKLINETNQLHKVPECTKYYIASLGKKLTKTEVLGCIAKLSNKNKVKSKKIA